MNRHNWPYWALLVVVLAQLHLPQAALVLFLALGRGSWPLALILLRVLWTQLPTPPHHLEAARHQWVRVVVEVSEPAVARTRGCRFVARVHHWLDRTDGPEPLWLVEWSQGEASEVGLGERWALEGPLVGFEPPGFPGDFDGEAIWRRRGVTQRLRVHQARFLRPPQGWVHSWRDHLTQRLADRLPLPRAALLCAIVYGDGSRLSQEQADLFRRAGVSHLLVASGTNVALLVAWICWLGARWGWGPVRCAGWGLMLVPLYVGLTGASPAMVRAGAMGWLALLARWSGHTLEVGRSLALGSLGVLLWDPDYLWDAGFQLSFAAVASLVWLLPRVRAWVWWTPLAASLACSLGVLPISLMTFHTAQPLAPLANLWMGPLVEGLLPVGLLLSLVDGLSPGVGHMLGRVLDPWLWFIEVSVRAWADWSPQMEVPDQGWWPLLAWLLVLAIVWRGPGWRGVLLASLTILASLLVQAGMGPSQDLRARLFWLGYSPALWLEQDGHQLLLCWDQRQAERGRRLAPFDAVVWPGPEQGWSWGRGSLLRDPHGVHVQQGLLRLGLGNPQELTMGVDSLGRWGWEGGEPRLLQKGEAWWIWHKDHQLWLQPWRNP